MTDLARLACSVLDGQDCKLGGSRVAFYLYHIWFGFRRQGVTFGRNQKIFHLAGIGAEFCTVLFSLNSRERDFVRHVYPSCVMSLCECVKQTLAVRESSV